MGNIMLYNKVAEILSEAGQPLDKPLILRKLQKLRPETSLHSLSHIIRLRNPEIFVVYTDGTVGLSSWKNTPGRVVRPTHQQRSFDEWMELLEVFISDHRRLPLTDADEPSEKDLAGWLKFAPSRPYYTMAQKDRLRGFVVRMKTVHGMEKKDSRRRPEKGQEKGKKAQQGSLAERNYRLRIAEMYEFVTEHGRMPDRTRKDEMTLRHWFDTIRNTIRKRRPDGACELCEMLERLSKKYGFAILGRQKVQEPIFES